MKDLPGEVEQLMTRVAALEHRVTALEHQPAAPALPATTEPAIVQAISQSSALEVGSAFSVLGRAMLGIAGAYLLRAAAQSNLLSSSIAAAIAIPYAIVWLAWAARTRAGAWFAATAYAGTSAFILAPMLWELIFRFQVLSPAAAAAILAAYIVIASALAWKRNLAPVFWVANVAAVLIALALSFTSRSSTPFIATLLLMLALCEFAEACGREPGARALTSLAADVAIWVMIYVYISPPSTRPDYPALGLAALIVPGFALFAIFLASVVYSTVLKHRRITVFEVVQTLIAFSLAAISLVAFAPPIASTIFGVSCIFLAAAGYAAVFLFFRRPQDSRDYRVFSTWSAALILTGCIMSLPGSWPALPLGLAAVAATALGTRFNRLALEFHGTVYLLAAASLSGLATFVVHALTSGLSGTPPPAALWTVPFALVCAAFCYALMPHRDDPAWQQQGLHLIVASLAIAGAAAFLVHGLMALISIHIQPGLHHLAFFRTLSICAAALILAYSGSRWRRIELTRISYAALAIVAVKLVAEDLRHGHLAYIAASITLFAFTLIAVPRVARRHRQSPGEPSPSSNL